MIFDRSAWPLLVSGLVFGLLLLIGTLATRGRRPHPILHKATWLALAALGIAWFDGGAAFTVLLAATAAFNYWIARAIETNVCGAALLDRRSLGEGGLGPRNRARQWLASAIALNVAVLLAIKELPWFSHGGSPLVPVGVSFLTFHGVSYVVDVYRQRASARTDAGPAGVYLLLLPQVVAGPIGYRSASAQVSRRAVGMSDFAYGIRRVVIGVGKRVLISSTCAAAANEIFAIPRADLTAAAAWLGILLFTIQVYFSFSAYADMAIGIGRLAGMRLEENFRWPYEAGSVEEFWRRWHTGLSGWFREYVGGPERSALHESGVILLCALWYGTTWGCLVWGLYHVAFLTLERRRIINTSRMPFAVRHAYLVLVVLVGWVFVRAGTLPDVMLFFKAMAGLNTPLRVHPLVISLDVWAALIAGIVGSAPLARALRRWSVAIDAATTSALMMLFATAAFLARLGMLLLPRHRYGTDTP